MNNLPDQLLRIEFYAKANGLRKVIAFNKNENPKGFQGLPTEVQPQLTEKGFEIVFVTSITGTGQE